LRETLVLAPNDNKALGTMSKVLAALRRWDECVEILHRALSSACNMRAAFAEQIIYHHRIMSTALNKLHDDQRAIAEIRVAMQYDLYNDDVLLSLGELLLRREDSAHEALVITGRLAEDNQIGKYHMLYGRALLNVGRNIEAAAAFREAGELDPNLPGLSQYLSRARTENVNADTDN
jgi:tetratricopeptide (TPR) repeat protein